MDIKIGINICCKYVVNVLTKLFRQKLVDVDVIVYILHVLQVMGIKQLQH